MRISHLSITNFGGIQSLQVSLPPVALISGDNGTGKSSFLDAIKYTYSKGHDPDVIRTGADIAEVIVTHDDGSQIKARASRKQNETVRAWKAPGAKRFIVSREEIDRLTNAISYNPLAFMDLTEKEQLATILRIMPIKVDAEEMLAAVGEASVEAADAAIAPGMNGLDVIKATEKAIYDARRARNTGADVQEKHASELEAALPPAAPEGQKWAAEAQRLRGEIEGLQAKQTAEISDLGEMVQATKDRENGDVAREHGAADAEYAEVIAAAERQRGQRKAAATNKAQQAIDAARGIANSEATRVKALYGPKIDALASQATTAQERGRAEQQAEGVRKSAGVARQHAAVDRERSTVLTAALERLGALKAAVAARLPIPGITIEDGRILNAEGVPYGKWNEEARLRFCLRLAVIAHGECGFIVVDGTNAIVGSKWDGVQRTAKKYAAEENLQFILARAVAGEPLTVEEVK